MKNSVEVKGFLVGKVNKGRGLLAVKINTNKKGLAKIESEPLQSYGSEFEIVTYCFLAIYLNGKFERIIETGNNDMDSYEINLMLKRFHTNDYYETTF
jgi:hypothetical protein